MSLSTDMTEELSDAFNRELDEATRVKMGNALHTWLDTEARKSLVMDLPQRLAKLQPRLVEFAKQARFEFVDGELVVKAVGDGLTVLNQLRFGTDWFEPPKDVISLMFSALRGPNEI